jgi:deoxyribonuclease-4
MSIAGGLHRAVQRAVESGCDCLQIFVKNQRQWRAGPLDAEAVRQWRQALSLGGVGPVVAHSAYLINPASPDGTIRLKSAAALLDELQRCGRLGVAGLVLHPGSHMGAGEASGLARVVEALNQALDQDDAHETPILLETTAGQGTALGYRFEHLAELIDRCDRPERLGVCLDTCHVFAAGYDVGTSDGCKRTLEEFDRVVGLKRLACIHCNDSKRELGSRVDRHEHIGQGRIGRDGFKCLINDQRLAHLPFILETPKGRDARGRDLDRINLATLRRMVYRPRARQIL